MPQGHPGDRFLAHVAQELNLHFGIEHSTIQRACLKNRRMSQET